MISMAGGCEQYGEGGRGPNLKGEVVGLGVTFSLSAKRLRRLLLLVLLLECVLEISRSGDSLSWSRATGTRELEILRAAELMFGLVEA